MYHLCEKYYKPIIVQYCIADCVSWVPKLTWLYKQTGLRNVLLGHNSLVCMGLTVPLFSAPQRVSTLLLTNI